MPTALICGVSGQDGAYLARLLLDKGYCVVGTSRDAAAAGFDRLVRLGIREKVETASLDARDLKSVLVTLNRYSPDEIYNLSGQSSVGVSFAQPVETMESIVIGALNFLEAIRTIGRPMRYFNPGSSECFGDTGSAPATEDSPYRPRSPYAVAKASAHWLASNYREAYGIFACTGILFNHESPLRAERFVTKKIVATVARIASGSEQKLRLGYLEIERDWGWAPDYVDAMWRMLQQDRANDFVIATGRAVSLKYFVARAFAYFGLEWQDHVEIDASIFRPSEIRIARADPRKALEVLGWEARLHIDEVIDEMCRSEASSSAGSAAAVP